MIDVAVVGAGPAGLLAAAHLARSGLDVLLLEDHPRVGEPTHCTGIVSLETADLTDIPDELVLGRLARARLVAPNGGEARHAWPAAGSDAILAIDRAAFDQGLARRAIDAGASLRTETAVRDVQLAADGVDLRTGAGSVRARTCCSVAGKSLRSTSRSVTSRNLVSESWPSPRMRNALARASRR